MLRRLPAAPGAGVPVESPTQVCYFLDCIEQGDTIATVPVPGVHYYSTALNEAAAVVDVVQGLVVEGFAVVDDRVDSATATVDRRVDTAVDAACTANPPITLCES